MKNVDWFLLVLIAFVVGAVLAFAIAIKQRDQATAAALKWEQLYRDCQAARQFSEPAHAADAVSDVTR